MQEARPDILTGLCDPSTACCILLCDCLTSARIANVLKNLENSQKAHLGDHSP